MTDRTLQEMTDDELIDLLADLEGVQGRAEKLLLGRMAKQRGRLRNCYAAPILGKTKPAQGGLSS